MNSLESLRKYTEIVVDSGEIELIKQQKPTDATTNPSLILKALNDKQYYFLLEEAILWSQKKAGTKKDIVDLALDKTAVNFGIEILKSIPGKISTEVCCLINSISPLSTTISVYFLKLSKLFILRSKNWLFEHFFKLFPVVRKSLLHTIRIFYF